MNALPVLFLQINLAWAAGYLLYRMCRGKDTFFRLRRCLLLGVGIFALAFPWLSAHWPAHLLHDMGGGTFPEIWLPLVSISPEPAAGLSASNWLWAAYSAVAAVLLLRTVVRLGSFIGSHAAVRRNHKATCAIAGCPKEHRHSPFSGGCSCPHR